MGEIIHVEDVDDESSVQDESMRDCDQDMDATGTGFDDETLRSLDDELSAVEQGLEQSSHQHSYGRVVRDSIADSLGRIQQRLESAVGSTTVEATMALDASSTNNSDNTCTDNNSNGNHNIYLRGLVEPFIQRFRMAQTAHSSRIPLQLLRGFASNEYPELQRNRSISRISVSGRSSSVFFQVPPPPQQQQQQRQQQPQMQQQQSQQQSQTIPTFEFRQSLLRSQSQPSILVQSQRSILVASGQGLHVVEETQIEGFEVEYHRREAVTFTAPVPGQQQQLQQQQQQQQPQPSSGVAEVRRRSILVASRLRVNAARGYSMMFHGGTGNEVTPPAFDRFPSRGSSDEEEEQKSAEQEQKAEITLEDVDQFKSSEKNSAVGLLEDPSSSDSTKVTPVLLDKRQSSGMSSSIINGSLSACESGSASTEKRGMAVYSWGSGGAQSLHDDDEEKTSDQALVNEKSRIGRAFGILSAASSATHTACSTALGQVLTCGINRDGCVDPTRKGDNLIKRPTLLESGLSQTRILQVSCGLDHTAALTDTGAVLTWGSNREGQLGHQRPFRTAEQQNVFCHPKAMVLTRDTRRAAAVACGHHFTMVLTTRMSLLVCGVEHITGYSYSRTEKDGGGDGLSNRGLPVSLPALEGLPLVAVAAGNHHAVVVTANGTAFSWGLNNGGCCGRPHPAEISTPVPVHVPKTQLKALPNSAIAFPNWANWEKRCDGRSSGLNGEVLSLADDVAVVHAACGGEHTVLVTRSGQVLVCGNNFQGQLGLSSNEKSLSPVVPLVLRNDQINGSGEPVIVVAAEAGEGHTLLLDKNGDVWQMGNGNFNGPERILSNKMILKIAAGGYQSIAIADNTDRENNGGIHPSNSIELASSGLSGTLEELLATVSDEMDVDNGSLSTACKEFAMRAEELLKYPSVLNGLFLDPSELHQMKTKLFSAGGIKVQQAVATSIQKGIEIALENMKNAKARMIYPESVRCLLIYISFFDREQQGKEDSIVFDPRGSCIQTLCETILGLPFEGYNAFLTWASTAYSQKLFVSMLVRPLLVQLNRGLKVDVDAEGVQHIHVSREAVPSIAGVLRWLYMASERMGGIAKPEDFYSDVISDMSLLEALYEDLCRMKKTNKSLRASYFFLCANPFLFSPQTKRNLLGIESQAEMIRVATSDISFDIESCELRIEPFWKLEIERKHMLEQTLEKIKMTKPAQLRKKLRIAFIGEEGIDAGGVTREFFQLLSEKLFVAGSALWTDRFGKQITWFNSDCVWDEKGFELTGVLVGLALYNSVLLDVHFPMAVYRKLLGLPLGLEDMVDEQLQKGLKHLLDYDGDDVEDVFCLTFEVTWMDMGTEHKIELKPGGSNIPVTRDNREEYVLLYVKWLLVDSIQPQWDAFERGVLRVMEGSLSLTLFRPEELELLVVGTPELDFDALENNTKYEGGYDKDSAVVSNFWRFIKTADRESQIKFLKFATGSSMAPIGGLGTVAFKIQRAGPDSHQLPTSHTCFDTLLLPDYGDNYDKLADRMGRAIVECEGFGLQ